MRRRGGRGRRRKVGFRSRRSFSRKRSRSRGVRAPVIGFRM